MGALLSIPMIPVQMAGTAIASCLGASVSSVVGSMLSGLFGGVLNGIAARVAYATLFLVNSVLSWLTLSSWVVSKLDLLKYACKGDECTSFVAVHRINSSLGLLHVFLASILTWRYRRSIQNGWWRVKLGAYVVLLLLSFFVLPAGFWIAWGNYIAPACSFVFVFIGLVLLVDAAHQWAEMCIENAEDEDEDESFWKVVLVGSTVSMYVAAVVLSVVMVLKFAPQGCDTNLTVITLNALLAGLVSIVSVHPVVQDYNPKASLAQAGMVSVYCTYLVLSAVTSEPDDKHCNPWARSKTTRSMATALGAAFTFVAIAYTTTRAASRAIAGNSPQMSSSISLPADSRREALMQAVREGSLPQSALDDTEWLETDAESLDESSDGYNYIVFHIVFFLATQYTASLLTINVETDPLDDFVPVGRSYFATWVKIVSSWLCYALYAWSLAAPVIFPDRF